MTKSQTFTVFTPEPNLGRVKLPLNIGKILNGTTRGKQAICRAAAETERGGTA